MSGSTERGLFSLKAVLWCVILSFCGSAYMIVRNIIKDISFPYWNNTFSCVVLCPIVALVIYIAYKKHDTNAMKPAIGMLLGVMVQQGGAVFVNNVIDPEYFKDYVAAGFMGYVILTMDLLKFIITLGICINHIIISSGHNSSKRAVRINIVLLCLLVVVYIFELIDGAFVFLPEKVFYLVMFYTVLTSSLTLIVIIEEKLDYFRLLREGK